MLTHPANEITSQPSPLGGGTWDFLDPSLLSSSSPAELSPATDLWALAITLLVVVLGKSPFEAFSANKYQRREMVKSGKPLQCVGFGDEGVENLGRVRALSGVLGWDVWGWFESVLGRGREGRVGVEEWMEGVGGRRERL